MISTYLSKDLHKLMNKSCSRVVILVNLRKNMWWPRLRKNKNNQVCQLQMKRRKEAVYLFFRLCSSMSLECGRMRRLSWSFFAFIRILIMASAISSWRLAISTYRKNSEKFSAHLILLLSIWIVTSSLQVRRPIASIELGDSRNSFQGSTA